jgi:hypothetical protein
LFERVWEYISQIARAQPDSAKAFLGLDSRVASSLNTGRAIYDLLHRAAAASGHHRYIFFLRLRECAQPLHLRAWDDIPFGTELDAVKSEATQTTGMTGQFRTVELERKEVAWDILLCRGVPSLLPPFADALSGEQSGYVLSGFLDLASCLALKPIPQEVREFLAGTPSRQDWPTNERLVAQIGAIHAAHGASNAEAFEALLGYRQVGPGVLYSLVEALAESAATEVRAGDRSIVGRLLDAAERADREDTRGAAAGAISDLLEWRLLTREEVARIPKVLESPTTDRHGRRELLFSLACCPPDEVPAAVLDRARIMLDEASAVQEGTVHAALTVIARQPKSRSDFDFLTRRLGLEESDGTFVAGEKTREGVVPHVVGRFFVAEPDRFGAAVTSLIENGDASALSYLLPSIRELGPRNPIGVVDALLARLRQADEGSVADLPLLHLLAEIAPNRLLTACAGVDAWLPQARSELANTLGRLLELSAASADLRFHLLIKLTGDGIYAVRRAAYRAAARCDPERLAKLIESWADWREVGREGPRRRAAECAAWLFDISGSINSLRGDQEPGVRDAFERSMLEREERDRASNYEKHVLSVSNPDGIIAAWRYGVALSQVGDDSTIYILAERGRQGLPAAVRFWLARVRKAVERRWNDVTTKWPEPWYARPGLLETFEGTIRAKDQVVTVSGTLWQMQGGQPGSFNSWGGWAAASNMLTGGQELLIPGRRAAKIIIGTSHWPDGNVVFSGNGPYPDKNL